VKLRRLAQGLWTIWGICNHRGDDPIQRLEASDTDIQRTVALLDRVAQHGTMMLPDNRNHAISDSPKILQLSAGMARLAYFYDGRRVIVVCHAFSKRGGKAGKASKSDLRVAIDAHRAYYAAKSAGSLEFDNGE
jgi:hypothetical protein